MNTFQTYPEELSRREAEAICLRRRIVAGEVPPETPTAPVALPPDPGATTDNDRAVDAKMPPDTIGLALSGGGIRSATFCLGFLQALARRGVLRHIDWLSTVSGGGYAGAFLGRFFDRLRETPTLAPEMVETALANPASAPIRWLRAHGEFIAPAGKADLTRGFAVLLRNLVTLHFILGLLLLGLYAVANGVRYSALERIFGFLPYLGSFGWDDMPIGRLVSATTLGIFWSPWFRIVELALLLLALPNALGYWLVSQDEPEGYSRPALLVAFILIIVLLGLGVNDGINLIPLFLAASILLAFPFAEWTWSRVRRANAAVGTGGAKVEQLRARTRLTRNLGMWLALIGVGLYFAVIDTLGHAIYEAYTRNNVSFVKAFAQLGGTLVMAFPILRFVARAIANARSERRAPGGRLLHLFSHPAVSAVLAVLLMAPPLILISYVAHALFRGGDPSALGRGWAVAVGALLISFIFAWRGALSFINRSSLQATYAARLATAYLGASNPTRRRDSGDDVVPGDDVDTLTQYKPHEAGGPVHLINICVNQTVDESSLHTDGDRRGVPMACSAVGVSLGRFHHARWVTRHGDEGAPSAAGKRTRQTIEPIGHVPGTLHPLLGADDQGPDELDVLPLRDWVSISGAAFGPGMGRSTNSALSVLLVLANLRIGYWWDSGLTAGDRGTRPRVSFVRRVLWLLPQIFQTQSRILHEAFARFRGPWDRFWHLSDGGHFENLGAYELIRRRVPFIILVDSGADPAYHFDDLANLQRRVRVDFQAEFEAFGEEQWKKAINADLRIEAGGGQALQSNWDTVREHVAVAPGEGGPIDQLLTDSTTGRIGQAVKKHAALLRVKYARAVNGVSESILLYVKASLSGDEPADVRQYQAGHPDFPHEGTGDQFFDEAQWESYRRLAEHIGEMVLGPIDLGEGTRRGLWLARLNPNARR